ncbi:hypothetical protein J5N97_018880 [Dioscorea zingiberensis]|uniref:Uncharacterized protein n=1 Tax=Dioscorea zingiberensis TaxID=325984 RepID=A0A9D5HBV8_9LILI|nr:hypothetical protein J5N97_018880 [Dioscorea zingiberensis]
MKPGTGRTIRRAQKLEHVQRDGPNWVLIAGSAVLSALSIRIGCKLKQAFETKRANTPDFAMKAKRRPAACRLHSNLYCFTQVDDGCCYCLAGISDAPGDIKQASNNPMSKEADLSLPLVKISAAESNTQNSSVMWASSPDRLELPQKPFHHSNSSESPCVSESGSDIYNKREVIQKLRQQLKRRDEMIMEMQAQIVDLQNSLTVQVAQSADLQSQLDSANRDLFDSEREIQRLRKAIADHCVAEVGSPDRSTTIRNWRPEPVNGHANGYHDTVSNLELHYAVTEKSRGASDRVEMLKREVGELKEVIEGKEFLLQSYKEEKVELCSKLKELQLRLAPQPVPNIL